MNVVMLVTISDIDVADKSSLTSQTDQFMFTCLQHITSNMSPTSKLNPYLRFLTFLYQSLRTKRLICFPDIHKLISIHEASFYKINQRNLPIVVKGN